MNMASKFPIPEVAVHEHGMSCPFPEVPWTLREKLIHKIGSESATAKMHRIEFVLRHKNVTFQQLKLLLLDAHRLDLLESIYQFQFERAQEHCMHDGKRGLSCWQEANMKPLEFHWCATSAENHEAQALFVSTDTQTEIFAGYKEVEEPINHTVMCGGIDPAFLARHSIDKSLTQQPVSHTDNLLAGSFQQPAARPETQDASMQTAFQSWVSRSAFQVTSFESGTSPQGNAVVTLAELKCRRKICSETTSGESEGGSSLDSSD